MKRHFSVASRAALAVRAGNASLPLLKPSPTHLPVPTTRLQQLYASKQYSQLVLELQLDPKSMAQLHPFQVSGIIQAITKDKLLASSTEEVHLLEKLFSQYSQLNVPKTLYLDDLASVVSFLIQKRLLKRALILLRSAPELSPALTNQMMELYAGARIAFWDLPREHTSFKYKPLMDVSQVLSMLQGHTLELKTVQCVIHALGKANQTEALTSYIDQVWPEDKPLVQGHIHYPDVDTVVSIVSSFAYNGHFDQALLYTERMLKQYKIVPTVLFWKRLFKWQYQVSNDSEVFDSLWAMMKSRPLDAELWKYRLLMLRARGKWELMQTDLMALVPRVIKSRDVTDKMHRVIDAYMKDVIKGLVYTGSDAVSFVKEWSYSAEAMRRYEAVLEHQQQKHSRYVENKVQKESEKQEMFDKQQEEDSLLGLW